MSAIQGPVFLQALSASFQAMAVIFVVGLVGWVSARRQWLTPEGIQALTRLMIDVIVPSKLGISMIRAFDMKTLGESGILVFMALGWTFGGMFLGFLACRLWRGDTWAQDKAIISLCAFQNGFYLPLPLAAALVPRDQFDLAAVYIGATVLVLSSLQWTIGVWLVRGESFNRKPANIRESLSQSVSPPMLSVLLGAALAFVPGIRPAALHLPGASPLLRILLDSISFMGEAMAPLAAIMLGALIAGCQVGTTLRWRAVLIPFAIRMLLMPAIAFWTLNWGFLRGTPPLVALVLLIEAASPPATNLSVAARRYEGEWPLVSVVLLVTYVLALVSLPLWTALGLSSGWTGSGPLLAAP